MIQGESMNEVTVFAEQLARIISTLYEDRLAKTNLQRGQYIYLLYLAKNDGSNQYDISRDLLIDKTTVAKALKKMEEGGIISRRTDSRDKRKVNVHLTAKGKQLYHEVQTAANEVEDMMTKNIHQDHVADFEHLLQLFIEELDLHWCNIKNYKGDTSYNVASQDDYRRLYERMKYQLPEDEQLFIEYFDQYILNWIRFSVRETTDSTLVHEFKFHSVSDPIIDGMSLLRQYESYHFANHEGDIQIRCRDNDIPMQKLLHKNNYTFHHYDRSATGIVYTYEKERKN